MELSCSCARRARVVIIGFFGVAFGLQFASQDALRAVILIANSYRILSRAFARSMPGVLVAMADSVNARMRRAATAASR